MAPASAAPSDPDAIVSPGPMPLTLAARSVMSPLAAAPVQLLLGGRGSRLAVDLENQDLPILLRLTNRHFSRGTGDRSLGKGQSRVRVPSRAGGSHRPAPLIWRCSVGMPGSHPSWRYAAARHQSHRRTPTAY